MSSDYSYDEHGEFFPYFILIVTGVITIPVTYSALKPRKDLENTAPRILSDYRPEHEDLIAKQRRKQKQKERKVKRMITAIIGWLAMAAMLYLIITTESPERKIWNPFDILGIKTGSSEGQIRKHYKKMSLTQHPDKRKPDPAKNETLDSINDHWVEVTKAFKALTDEDVKYNYEHYGHPDGKQSFKIGIALPSFIITNANGKYVLLLYAALLAVALPLLVGKWWYGTQRLTKDKILISSASKLFMGYKNDLDAGGVIGALSSGDEFQESLKTGKDDETSSKVESKLVKAQEESKKGMSKQERERLLNMDDENRRKILGLLWAYLYRIDLKDPKLDEQKYEVAPIAFPLNEALQSMSLAFANTDPLLASYHASQHLIQAIPPGSSPLLQLPHFTPKVIRVLEEIDPEMTTSVQSFMALPETKRRAFTCGRNLMSLPEFYQSMSVAAQLPYARIETAFFKVTGERFITAGSLIQLIVKLRIIPPGTDSASIPPVDSSELEDPDPEEGDLDALHGRKNKKGDKKTTDDEKETTNQGGDTRVQPPLAHSPFYAREHSPTWRVFLADPKNGKVSVPPFSFRKFDAPVFKESEESTSPNTSTSPTSPTHKTKRSRSGSITFTRTPKPTCAVQTLRMQFQAPPQEGAYPFNMHLVCDSYVGLDSCIDITMNVQDANYAENIEEEEEISEPEEDTLAGQMNAMRTGGGETKKKGGKRPAAITENEDDSDDSSDTEGNADSDSSSDTDTDTDTDEE
ncbi:MAG: secretory subunit [Alyxoria varia]|nr:MAG: secretory subunit [Alyxoria varia]